jgi:hypothetical protein
VRRHHAFQIAIPTLRDPRLQLVAEDQHRASQKASGYIKPTQREVWRMRPVLCPPVLGIRHMGQQ